MLRVTEILRLVLHLSAQPQDDETVDSNILLDDTALLLVFFLQGFRRASVAYLQIGNT